MLGIQEDTVAAHGVRRMYPWFRPGAAYVLTNTGAESALKTCTPLRWRLDCQLAGYAAASRKHLPAADRLFGPSIHPIGYFLTPPLIEVAEERERSRKYQESQEGDENGQTVLREQSNAARVSPEEEERLIDELDAVVAWSMRLTDEPMPPGSFKRIYCPDREIEGHSNMFPVAIEVFNELAENPEVKTICEVGFNGGHSALRWLLHSTAKIYSFDLGSHHYSKPAAMWLSKKFPGRLEVAWGDSLVSVPKFHEANPNVKFDLVLIDGGHSTDLARADLKNFLPMANPKNRIIMDDTFLDQVRRPWEEFISAGKVVELQSYGAAATDNWGFSVGYYTTDDSAQSS